MSRVPAPAAAALELRPGQSVELLKELHILTREGKINQDSRRKLKQVYHLYQFIEKVFDELNADDGKPFVIADHGAGKSYLGFILYDLYVKNLPTASIYGIESRTELVLRSRALAQKLGFARMFFMDETVAQSTGDVRLPARVDVVSALHACDTATDDAIAFALDKHARAVVLVPCCQAEVARCLNLGKKLALARTPLAQLWRHPLHAREIGSQLTNVLRCLYLEASGYQVTVTELVGWEHSMKNELILARYNGHRKYAAEQHLREILHEFGLNELLQTRFTGLTDNSPDNQNSA